MTLCLAINYSGRAEIADAVKDLCKRACAGQLNPEDVDEATIDGALYTAGYRRIEEIDAFGLQTRGGLDGGRARDGGVVDNQRAGRQYRGQIVDALQHIGIF